MLIFHRDFERAQLAETPERAMINIHNVLVATDFSASAEAALEYGRTLAAHLGARLHVLHVAEELLAINACVEEHIADMSTWQRELEEAARKQLDEQLTGMDAARIVLTSNAAAQTIVDYSKRANIDLIVLGTHGRGALVRWVMGSVAERVVRTASCPVLTVHHPEHEFVLPLPDAVPAEAQA
jgi:nucleotide-binding universal stress UspA family protein